MAYFTMYSFEFLSTLCFLLAFLLYRLMDNFDHWEKLNVKGPKPIPLFGNFKDVFLGKINIGIFYKICYDKFINEPYFGVFEAKSPILVIKDPELIKDVLVRDFNCFSDRGIYGDHKDDPWALNLINLERKRWRPLRKYFTPAFTQSKLKEMYYLLIECMKGFEKYVDIIVKKGEPIELRTLCSMYTTSTIGVCAFGLNSTISVDEISHFQKIASDYLDCSFGNVARRVMRDKCPRLYFLLQPLIKSEITTFLMDTMQEIFEYRTKMNIKRNDFVDLLIELRNHPEKLSEMEINDVFLASQALIFFIAGYETSSASMSTVLYELTLNPQYQSKLREEIRQVLDVDGKLTFDNIRTMKYLDKVFKEALRKYPPGTCYKRIASSPYTFSGTDLTVPKNARIIIPAWAIHHDPNIYPDPDVFDPERFSDENERSRHPMNYIPFGDGPRNCIGLRFAEYQVKLGIATLISKYKLEICDKTCSRYVLHPRTVIAMATEGLYAKFVEV